MKFLKKLKDGGPESRVTGYFLVEIKSLFSIVLLKFEDGSRDAYHSHAFNAVSWLLSGELREMNIHGYRITRYWPSFKPILTPREMFHKVTSIGTSWVLSFRGPWSETWQEYVPDKGDVTLTHGRKVVE